MNSKFDTKHVMEESLILEGVIQKKFWEYRGLSSKKCKIDSSVGINSKNFWKLGKVSGCSTANKWDWKSSECTNKKF